MLYALAVLQHSGGNAISFMVGFLLLVCVLAVVIIAAKWLLGLAGVAVPPPLMYILGILLFVVLLLWVLNYSGYYRF